MRTSTERIDQLALVWLLVSRKESRASGFHPQLKSIANGADDQKRLGRESIARLRERGLIEPGNLLKLTEAGRRRALEALGVSRIPESSKKKLEWAKKVLLLRSIDVEPTPAALKSAGTGDVLAARVLARRHKVDRKFEASASKILAVLARRALGVEERPSFKFHEAFPAVFLTAASPVELGGDGTNGHSGFASTASLRLADCKLSEFATLVTEAARSSVSGRWHGAVFISHVWETLRARGDVGITFEKFQRRLIEAFQANLVDLSRADLVDAMPAADISASETTHSGARFHFVRLEQLAS